MDFTAGIRSRYGVPGGHVRSQVLDDQHDGSAQLAGTYQCYGDPLGGLRPLPRRRNMLAFTPSEIGGGSTGWAEDTLQVGILDMAIMSPIQDNTFVGNDTGRPLDAVFITLFWYRDPTGGDDYERHARLRQYKTFKVADPEEFYNCFSRDEATTSTHYLAYSSWFSSRAAYGIEDTDDPNVLSIGLPQMRGFISILQEDDDTAPDLTDMHQAIAYPANIIDVDPASDAVTQGNTLNAGYNEMGFMFGHQGRTVIGFRRSGPSDDQFLEPFGANGVMPMAEALGWSGVNLAFLTQGDPMYANKSTFMEENPSGYGAWASMNASELFMVKNKGGGVVIRGSLNNPTVTRLPGIEPVKGMMNIPAVTPMGCFYGSKSGIWLWAGSDVSECVSNQIEGCFWEAGPVESIRRPGLKGRFAYNYPFVYVSNDWVFDCRTMAWFKLVDRETLDDGNSHAYMFYDTAWDGRVYASPGVIDINSDVMVDYLDETDLNHTYQWHSQPFAATFNSDVEFKKIIVVAQGIGQISVALEGLDGTYQTETFDIDSDDRPVRLEVSTTTRCTDPSVVLRSVATDTDDAAPTIYAVHLGYNTQAGIPSEQTAS